MKSITLAFSLTSLFSANLALAQGWLPETPLPVPTNNHLTSYASFPQNGDFEDVVGFDSIAPWSYVGDVYHNAQIIPDGFGAGVNKVLQINSGVAVGGIYLNFGGTAQCAPIAMSSYGHAFTLSANVATYLGSDSYAGLWMRFEGAAGQVLSFDNMDGRGVTGISGYKSVSTTLFVPVGSVRVCLGTLMVGQGTAWFDNVHLGRF